MKLISLLSYFALTYANHRCDNRDQTRETFNGVAIWNQYEQATADRDRTIAAFKAYQEDFNSRTGNYNIALAAKVQAEKALTLSTANIDTLAEAYKKLQADFAACDPDTTDCTLSEQSRIAIEMNQKGQEMIANDKL